MGFVIGVGSMADIIIRSGRGDWWDPNDAGLSVVAAYRAINSVGTPWPGGPTVYAQSLVNQSNPGVNDLVEGNGAVPWVQATGWGFVEAAVQYFDTGLVPADDQSWSMFAQYANATTDGMLAGLQSGVNQRLWLWARVLTNQQNYANGVNVGAAPGLVTGNMAVAGNQGYRNGIADGGAIGPWGGATILPIYIGAFNNAGIAAFFADADLESIAIYNGGAAAVQAEAAAIAAAMAAL